MLTEDRKVFLLDRLARDGRLIATDLAAELGISEDTIRRDLRQLAGEGRLIRVHGGALPASPTDRPFLARTAMHPEAKLALARAAAGLIRPGQVVIVDGGTTHQALPQVLPAGLRFTLVTHSPALAAAMEPLTAVEVVLIGGRLFRHSMVAAGPLAMAGFLRLRADLCLLGVTGVHPDPGLTTGDAEEAALKAAMLDVSAEVAVLATPDKLGTVSPWTIAPLDRLTMLITTVGRPDWLPHGVAHLQA